MHEDTFFVDVKREGSSYWEYIGDVCCANYRQALIDAKSLVFNWQQEYGITLPENSFRVCSEKSKRQNILVQ